MLAARASTILSDSCTPILSHRIRSHETDFKCVGLLQFIGRVLARTGAERKSATQAAMEVADVRAIDLPQAFTAKMSDGAIKIQLDTFSLRKTSSSFDAGTVIQVVNDGGVVLQTAIDPSGETIVEGLEADKLYAVVVQGVNSHAVLPIMPLSEETAASRGVQHSSIRIPIIQASVQEVWKNFSGYTGYGAGLVYRSGKPYGPSNVSTTLEPVYEVRLTKDRVLNGIVLIPELDLPEGMRFANITLFNEAGQPFAQTTSNEQDGKFAFANIPEGKYGIIAAGPSGYAAFAIKVLAADAATTASVARSATRLVAFQESGTTAVVPLVPPTLMPSVTETIEEDLALEPIGAPVAVEPPIGPPGFPTAAMPGGFGGAGGGGLGGGSGILGSGPLATLAPLARLVEWLQSLHQTTTMTTSITAHQRRHLSRQSILSSLHDKIDCTMFP